MMLGMLPSLAMTWRRDTASTLPTTFVTLVGLYFSTHGISDDTGALEAAAIAGEEEEAAIAGAVPEREKGVWAGGEFLEGIDNVRVPIY